MSPTDTNSRRRLAALLPIAAAVLAAPRAAAQTPVRPELVAAGFTRPILVLSPPDDPRLFVIEQQGKVKLVEDGVVLPTPYLDLTDRLAPGGERGLLGMAFHPEFATNGFAYVNYTDLQGDTVVVRFETSADVDVADPSTATIVIGPVPQPSPIHNGGCLVFGPDGKLFVGMGDGGHQGNSGPGHAPEGNAQSPFSLHGKLLRLDVDRPYPHIPSDNPFAGDIGVLSPIWAFGLREPWRFSFDRATGDLYVGDVGEGAREEVDFVAHATWSAPDAPILNFGWRCQEGTVCTGLSGCTCSAEDLTAPIEEFDHSVGCAVIGGYVYRGCALPELRGTYFYGAFCYTGPTRVFGFTNANGVKGPTVEWTAAFTPGAPGTQGLITSFGEDAAGELYFCNLEGGVYKLVPAELRDCNANGVADGCDIAEGSSRDLDFNGVPDECEGVPAPLGRDARRSDRSGRPLLPY